MVAALPAAAPVVSANMFFAMVLVVVVTLYIGIKVQLPFQESGNSVIRIAGYSAIKFDAGCCQSRLSAAADTAANQSIGIQCAQDACQGAVSAAVGIHDIG